MPRKVNINIGKIQSEEIELREVVIALITLILRWIIFL